MWGSILEKAMAKLHGNYEHIIEGNPREATMTLTGSPSLYQMHDELDIDSIWDQLVLHDKNGEMIFFNTPVWSGGREKNSCGLSTGHSYVVLSAKKLSNGERLIKLRNPWGEESYKCAYSDES